MNERFETIINTIINKRKNFRDVYVIVISFFLSGCYIRFFTTNVRIGDFLLIFGFITLSLFPIRIKIVKKHYWILNSYQNETNKSLSLLTTYYNNLNGSSLINYFLVRVYHKNLRILYKQAIEILKTMR